MTSLPYFDLQPHLNDVLLLLRAEDKINLHLEDQYRNKTCLQLCSLVLLNRRQIIFGWFHIMWISQHRLVLYSAVSFTMMKTDSPVHFNMVVEYTAHPSLTVEAVIQ